MSNLQERQALVAEMAGRLSKETYKGGSRKVTTPRKEYQSESRKVVSLEEAIRGSGLKDGMTVSFHHHFRGGDKVLNMVMDKIAEMGFKDIRVAASSLNDVHRPLIEHIKNGVVTQISTSGMRGELAKAISHGLMEEPVVFRSHGARGSAIANGDLHIDVAFWVRRRAIRLETHVDTHARLMPSRFAARWAMPCPTLATPTRW